MKQIKVTNLSKNYKGKNALNNISVEFEYGKIYGLLGRNGAGKSTLLNIIANRIFPSLGSVSINGLDSQKNINSHNNLFAMSEADTYLKDGTVLEHLIWTSKVYDDFDLELAKENAKLFNLDTHQNLKSLSSGYYTIFKVIIALSQNVDFVIYDEPVVGLDANHRELFYKLLIESYQRTGSTIIIATHLIEEVSNIIEALIIIDHGEILCEDNVENLLSRAYQVSGEASLVTEYIKDKAVLHTETLGTYMSAYLLEDTLIKEETLEYASVSLQKLFTLLTDEGGHQ